jgi:hypothetical protein
VAVGTVIGTCSTAGPVDLALTTQSAAARGMMCSVAQQLRVRPLAALVPALNRVLERL